MPDILEIDSVIKSFGNKQILTDIYLKCTTGDIIGILGRNGTGKSTLLKIIFGTMPAERKSVRIDGIHHNQLYKVKNQICYLPQIRFLPKHMKVEKVVRLYLDKQSSTHFFNDEFLSNWIKMSISDLSGGEQRYLEVKLLLYANSRFVLLDEPFNKLSPIMVAEIKKLILNASASKGIIFTDHDYRNVLDLAKSVYLVFDGGLKPINNNDDLIRWGYICEMN